MIYTCGTGSLAVYGEEDVTLLLRLPTGTV